MLSQHIRNWITWVPLSGRDTSSNKTTVTSKISTISTWEDLQEHHQTQIIEQQQWTNKMNNTKYINNNILWTTNIKCSSFHCIP